MNEGGGRVFVGLREALLWSCLVALNEGLVESNHVGTRKGGEDADLVHSSLTLTQTAVVSAAALSRNKSRKAVFWHLALFARHLFDVNLARKTRQRDDADQNAGANAGWDQILGQYWHRWVDKSK